MRRYLTSVLEYFSFFVYAPSFSEIYTFFPKKITKKDLKELIMREVKGKTIVKLQRLQDSQLFSLFHGSTNHYPLATNHSRYTLPQYSIQVKNKSIHQLADQIQIQSKNSLPTIQRYFFILKYLPFVRFVGITGATAMNGYSSHDDVDLFIITQTGTLWTTRFFVVVLAKLLGIYGGVGVCLNLFFDEKNMSIPSMKQNSYVAHELLQMKPVIDNNNTHSLLIQANEWIFRLFPNAKQSVILNSLRFGGVSGLIKMDSGCVLRIGGLTRMTIGHALEYLFKSIQLPIIKNNKTSFLITPTQLWLFKRDFEKKLKRNGLGR